MTVQTTHNGDVRIAYEALGPADGEPLLLIMGLDFQMVWWPDGFCQALAERGFRVARFDNRDTGLSTHFRSPHRENPFRVLLRGSARPAYTAEDMVGDGIAVMDALGWSSAHVLGASMGSALALATAVLHPDRVRTVTSTMGGPLRTLETLRYLKFGMFIRSARVRHPDTGEGAVRTMVDLVRLLASPQHPFDEDWARCAAEISHAVTAGSGHHPKADPRAALHRRARRPAGRDHRADPGHQRRRRPAHPPLGGQGVGPPHSGGSVDGPAGHGAHAPAAPVGPDRRRRRRAREPPGCVAACVVLRMCRR